MAPILLDYHPMSKKINDLAPVLLAIGRQIAGQRGASCRSDRPERDLPILLIPNSGHGLTGSPRDPGAELPYLLGAASLLDDEAIGGAA